MNIQDLIDWKKHPVTQVIFSQLSQRTATLKDGLASSAGIDPIQDARTSGAILAYTDVLNIEIEESQDD